MTLLDNALKYLDRGFSVIPVRPDKTPYIKWEPFQKRRATADEIKAWWGRWPRAMIGIVTGSISGVVVIDIDEPQGHEALLPYIGDSIVCPTATTPRGGEHIYFQTPEKPISNNARVIPGCDFRGEGGYVVAPPSVNGTGKAYGWIVNIDDVEPPPLPEPYKYLLIL